MFERCLSNGLINKDLYLGSIFQGNSKGGLYQYRYMKYSIFLSVLIFKPWFVEEGGLSIVNYVQTKISLDVASCCDLRYSEIQACLICVSMDKISISF